MSVAGFILSLVGLVSGIIPVPVLAVLGLPIAVTGLILSIIGRKRTKKGLATAGMVIGIIAVVFTAITFFTCGICVMCAATGTGLM